MANVSKKILWITTTAVFLALLIALQYFTKSFGQLVTGSAVNFVLIAATLVGGIWSGVTVAAISPWLAFLLGIGPAFLPIVPMIMIGNIVIVVAYALITGKVEKLDAKGIALYAVSIVVGAALKFAVLFVGVTKIALPLLNLPEAKQGVISAQFSFPQLITALIGGVIACLVVPVLKKALGRKPV